jgi:hypothetical protein
MSEFIKLSATTTGSEFIPALWNFSFLDNFYLYFLPLYALFLLVVPIDGIHRRQRVESEEEWPQ